MVPGTKLSAEEVWLGFQEARFHGGCSGGFGDLGGHLQRGRHQLVIGHDPIHQTATLRLPRIDAATAQA